MGKYDKDAQKFSALFKKALTDMKGGHKKTTKEQERDYYNLNSFINGLKKKEQIDACLDEYLKIYTKYPTQDRRSKFVFAQLLNKSIEMSKVDDKYIDDISDILDDDQRPFRSPLRLRYEDLEQREKADIQSSLKYKKARKKERTSILDLLKKSYYKANKKKPARQELLDYDPASSKDLEVKYKALRDKCSISWSKHSAETIKESLKDFTAFLSNQNDSSKLFQVLKWTRDVVTVRKQTVTTRDGRTITVTNPPSDDLDRELYFQCVYWLFRYAIKHGYSMNYKGFTNEEKGFFFDPLSPAYFYQQYVNRYTAGITRASEFLDTSVLFLRLLIFARMNDAELQNNEDTSRIRKFHETTTKTEQRKKSFHMGVGSEVLRGDMRIGDKVGKVSIAYFDAPPQNMYEKFIYVEFEGLENLLFKINIIKLSQFSNSSFYTAVWLNTRHLLKLIPLIFQLLGYTFSLVTGGLSALATDILTDVVVGEYAEAANLGPGSTMALSLVAGGGPSLAKGAIVKGTMSKALGRELVDLAGDEARSLRQAENLMTDEARAVRGAEKAETAVSGIHPNERFNMPDNGIQNIGTGGGRRGTGGSDAGGSHRSTGGSNRGGVDQGSGGSPGGGGTSGTIPPRPPRGEPELPEFKVSIDSDYAEALAEHVMQNSKWMRQIEGIYRVADLRKQYERIRIFIADYWRETGTRIEVMSRHAAQEWNIANPNLKIGASNWGRYLPERNRIILHEDIFTKRGVNPVEEFGHEVGAAELDRVLGIPKDSIPKVHDVPPAYSNLLYILDRRIKPTDLR